MAYGPPENASIRYVGDNRLGVVVSNSGNEHLIPAVARLSADVGLRQEVGQRAWLRARDQYTSDRVRPRF